MATRTCFVLPAIVLMGTIIGPAFARDANHLLLTEVCVKPTYAEFIEIYNPTDVDIDLITYHLTDAIYRPTSQYYWRIVEWMPSEEIAGGGNFWDFHARFPGGVTLAAGEAITIAIAGSEGYFDVYGQPPDFELFEDGAVYDDVPDMAEVFPGSIVGETFPGLSNAGEIVILYNWNGAEDLVTDVDVFVWGVNDTYRFDKSGVVIDGPDGDDEPSFYHDDTPVPEQAPFLAEHGWDESYQRHAGLDEGTETASGGNGVNGHDETSEPLPITWTTGLPNPGSVNEWTAVEQIVSWPVTSLVATPNPFNPTTTIHFELSSTARASLAIYDLRGRQIVVLENGELEAGDHAVVWRGRDRFGRQVGSGTYMARLKTESGTQVRKLALAR